MFVGSLNSNQQRFFAEGIQKLSRCDKWKMNFDDILKTLMFDILTGFNTEHVYFSSNLQEW